MEMSDSKTVPDGEEVWQEAVPKNKLTLDNLVEGFWLFRTAFDLFYLMDPSVIWALKLKWMVEEGLVPYTNIFREIKKWKSQIYIMIYLCKIHWVCLPLFSPLPLLHIFCLCAPETARPTLLSHLPQPTQAGDDENDLCDDQFPLDEQ